MSKQYDTAQPYTAAYIVLRRDNKVALVLRENTSWMNGYYGLPSGKVEKGESFAACAVREGKEEVGIDIKLADLRYIHTSHRNGNDGTNWVDVYFEPTIYEGEPYNAEPHMHAELAWFDINDLPENTLDYTKFTLSQIEQGNYFSEFGWATA